MEDSPLNAALAGARGDGITDNTGLFQQLLDRAAATGGTVTIPAGRYLTGELRVPAGVGIVGSPTFSWKGTSGSVLVLNDPQARCLINLTEGIGARLDGLCLEGGGLGSGVHGILVDKPDYGHTEDSPLIERCKVTGFTGDGVHLGRIWCFRIRGNMFSENRGHGLCVRGWDGFVLDNWLSRNGGAGYAAIDENNAVTITGNRIEWNEGGGVVVFNGSHYNITGNYIDRCNPGIRFEGTPDYQPPKDRIVGRVGYSTFTGNMIYRSGKPEWVRDEPSAHLVIRRARGVTVVGNTFVAGRDDENNAGSLGFSMTPNWSPAHAVVAGGLTHVVIRDNVMDSAAMDSLVVDEGGHGDGFVLEGNPGGIFRP